MRVLFTSCAAWALVAGSAFAQYHPYGAPAPLSAPGYLAANGRPQPPNELEGVVEVEPTPLAPHEGEMVYDEGVPGVSVDGCGGCSDCAAQCCSCGPCAYASFGALIMSRDDCDPIFQLSYDPSNPNNAASTLLGTQFLSLDDYQGGWEFTFGYYLGCSTALEVTYWGLEQVEDSAQVSDPNGQISTPLNFNNLNFSQFDPVNVWFANAQAQRVSMDSEFHNVEVNLVGDACSWQTCSGCWTLGWLGGFRWFSFSEGFEFASSENSVAFGVDPTAEAYYNVDVDNDLYGFQFGGKMEYRRCNWSLYAAPKVGIFWNHIELETTLRDGTGRVAYDFQNPSYRWDIQTDKEDFSTLAQIDLGGEYRFCCNWTVYGGYRLVSVTSVAGTIGQIPTYLADYSDTTAINTCDSLLLHGAFAGVRYEW